MKKLLFLVLLVSIQINITQAQVGDPSQIKIKSPKSTVIKGDIATYVMKLPDLRITSLNVNQISPASGGKYLEISYTVKNDGTAPIDLSIINMTGRIKLSATTIRDDAGCGSGITTRSGTLLNPGEVTSGSYRCYAVLDFSVYKYYVLSTATNNTVKELDVTNNSATTTIRIQ